MNCCSVWIQISLLPKQISQYGIVSFLHGLLLHLGGYRVTVLLSMSHLIYFISFTNSCDVFFHAIFWFVFSKSTLNWFFPSWDFYLSPIVVSFDLLSGCYFRRNLVTRIFRPVLYYAVHCDWVCCSLCFSGRSFGYCPSLYFCFPLGRGYICLCFGFLLKMGFLF